jgi:type II secretory pathway pseudopilin PulG
MTINSKLLWDKKREGFLSAKNRAFTLVEVMIAFALSLLFIGGMIYGYIGSAQRAEWTGYSIAAQSLASQSIEQTKSCQWNIDATPPIDELITANFPPRTNILDLPVRKGGSNAILATNFITITTAQVTPAVKCIRVDCVWPWVIGRKSRVFTNTIVTYRSAR